VGGGPDFPFLRPEITIGRDPGCDVVLRLKTVSGLHCRLFLSDGYWRVVDLHSRNGVRIDGVRCEEGWVFPESRLSIADQRFQLDYEPEGERPIPDHLLRGGGDQSLMARIGVTDRQLDAILSKVESTEPPSKRRDLSLDM
jgi:pSer/pThr/pTyr-binding forkhead associated (FHA) protein